MIAGGHPPDDSLRPAVFLAANPGNLGMYSVDRAAGDFFARHGIDAKFFVTQRREGETKDIYADLDVQFYRRPADLDGFSHIVFWGDFQNNPQYGMQDFAQRDVALGLSRDRVAAFDRWSAIYFQNHDLAAGRPVVSIGNNFMSMSTLPEDRLRPTRGSEPFASFSRLLPRDPVSVDVLTHLFPGLTNRVSLGLDCAFLVDTKRFSKPATPEDDFTYFFFRSKLENTRDLIRSIEDRTGLNGVPLDRWLNTRPDRAARRYSKAMARVISSQFLISDTYHVCVNGLNAGVPTFTVAKSDKAQDGTLGDHKKAVLFGMLGLGSQCFSVSEDRVLTPDTIAQICDSVSKVQDVGAEHHCAKLDGLKHTFEAEILSALGALSPAAPKQTA